MNTKMLGEELRETLVEDLEKCEYLSLGNTIAAAYLKGKVIDLLAEVYHHDIRVRAYLTRGILETLVRNISIPRDPETKRYSRQTIIGILALKESQVSVKKVLDEIEDLFADYERAMQQAYTQLKPKFQIKLDETRKALEQQLGAKVKLDVERQSQFRKKWRNVSNELNTYYEQILENYKHQLMSEIQ